MALIIAVLPNQPLSKLVSPMASWLFVCGGIKATKLLMVRSWIPRPITLGVNATAEITTTANVVIAMRVLLAMEDSEIIVYLLRVL